MTKSGENYKNGFLKDRGNCLAMFSIQYFEIDNKIKANSKLIRFRSVSNI